ncbi:MAG: hypothetical protein CMP20_09430 [Rickettsiales bacterium]|nr:hypothetical protein [Rickettsiales bacterium]
MPDDLSDDAKQAAITAAFIAATTGAGVFAAVGESGKAALNSIISAFYGVKTFTSGTVAVFAQLVQDLADVDRKVFESFDSVYESIIKATYGFFLNPLIAGIPLPELREENVYGAFAGEPFAYKDVFDPAVTGDDTIKRSQLRNLIRRFVYQARAIVQLVHGKAMDDYGEGDIEGAQQVLDAMIKAFKRAAGNQYAYYAYFAEILIALRVALTFSFALIATIQRGESDGTIDFEGDIETVVVDDGEELTTDTRVYSNFSSILRKAIKEYKLQPLGQYIVTRARKPIVNPIRDTDNEITLGVFNALAPTLNSINDTLGRLGLVERETIDVDLFVSDERPTDLKPNALAAQLVHMLNFHAVYAPRSDIVVENYVLPAFQEVEFVFDGSAVTSDPNTPLIRAFVFIETSMVEDWSLFCRSTGFLRVFDVDVSDDRPTNRNDTEYPSQLANNFVTAGTYWRSASMAIEAFTQLATRDNALSVLNAFTAVQSFHAQNPFPVITNVLNQTDVFAADTLVQDEDFGADHAIWRTAKTYKTLDQDDQVVDTSFTQFNPPAYVPARELVYLTAKGLFESLFHSPSPYGPDGFELQRVERSSMFLNSDSVPLLVQTVVSTMYQLALVNQIEKSAFGGLLSETQELLTRVTIPYSPENSQNHSFDRQKFTRAVQDLLEQAVAYNPDEPSVYLPDPRQRRSMTGSLRLWKLGSAVVDTVLISSIVKNQTLIYPPAAADLCVGWLRLFSVAFGLENEDTTSGIVYLTLKLDNRQGEIEDLLTVMNLAYEQLEAIKILLDPKQRHARKATELLQTATTDYQAALVEYYAHPTSANVSDLSLIAQELVELLQVSEAIYTESFEPVSNVSNLLRVYQTLLGDTVPDLVQIQQAEDALRDALRQLGQTDANATLLQAMQNAREMLWTYFDVVKITLPTC